MRRIFFISLALVLQFSIVYCQAPDTLWTRSYGGSNFDDGVDIGITSDGGYIIAGETESFGHGSSDVWLLKTGNNGDTLWTRTFGGSGVDRAVEVQQTRDGGYIIAGETNSFGAGSYDVYAIKTDSSGDTVWTRTFGGTGTDKGRGVRQTDDGGFIIVGFTQSYGAGDNDVWLIKTDLNGDTAWTQTYGGIGNDFGRRVRQTFNSGYIIAGGTSSYGSGDIDYWLIKTDSLGVLLWSRTFGEGGDDYCRSVEQTADSGFIVCGDRGYESADSTDIWLIKTSANGDSVWSLARDSNQQGYYCLSVEEIQDRGYVTAGWYWSLTGSSYDVFLFKCDANGSIDWDFSLPGSQNDKFKSVQQTIDGGFIAAGHTFSQGAGSGDAFLIRLDQEGNLVGDSHQIQPLEFTLYPPYPNPFNQRSLVSFHLKREGLIRLAVYDIAGREAAVLAEGFYPAGAHRAVWEAAGVASGVYLVRLTAGDFNQTRKIVLLK